RLKTACLRRTLSSAVSSAATFRLPLLPTLVLATLGAVSPCFVVIVLMQPLELLLELLKLLIRKLLRRDHSSPGAPHPMQQFIQLEVDRLCFPFLRALGDENDEGRHDLRRPCAERRCTSPPNSNCASSDWASHIHLSIEPE